MINIVIVSNKPAEQLKTLQTLHCPSPHRIIVSKAFGFGNARNIGAEYYGSSGLMVQFNDDLVLSSKIWDFILNIKQGEFAFQVAKHVKAGDQPCSRVFIIHLEDFWKIGGCDSSLKYFYEDGEFYHRAIKQDLKFRIVPDEYAVHIPHVHAFYNPSMVKMAKIEYEVCKCFVKYKRNVMNDFYRFFVPFRSVKVVFQHLLLRTVFTIYWIIKGVK